MSSIEYKDGSVKFLDVFLHNRKVIVLTTSDLDFNMPIYKFPTKSHLEVVFKKFDSAKQMEDYKNSVNVIRHIDTMLYGDNPWYGNMGHALLDGLYPIYLSMIKFDLDDRDFVYASHSWNNYTTKSTEAIQIFSGNKILNTDDFSDQFIKVDTLISGCGVDDSLCGNCVINKTYRLYGQKEFGGLVKFKNRMLNKFNLSTNQPINTKNPKIIIIQNKRFSHSEREVLKTLANKYSAKYIDWYHDYKSFYDQLFELNDVDIQITGPGTGMLYLPFLKHGAVNINLGYMEHTQTNTSRPNIFINESKCEDHIFPGWMEQSVCAACDYIHTLYYDRFSNNELEFNSLCDIVDRAVSLLRMDPIYTNNWNIDALIFKEYCEKIDDPSDICSHLTSKAFFIELFVNEHPLAINDRVDLDLLQTIKRKYCYDNRYNIGKTNCN